MKKLIFFLIISTWLVSSLCSAKNIGYDNLKYDFPYLYKWTLYKMNVYLDSDKLMPKLAFASPEFMDNLLEKKYLLKRKVKFSDNTALIKYECYGFYEPSDFTIYMVNIPEYYKNKLIEGFIVHEIVHSIQHIYQGYETNSTERESEASKYEAIFNQEHFWPNLKTRP